MRPRTGVIAIALAGVALDQVSKAIVVSRLESRAPVHVIGDVVMFDVSRNPGAAFSFAPAATILFSALAAVAAIVIVRTAGRIRSIGWAFVLGLILAGAVGNLIDRLVRSPGFGRGHVVDFIYVQDFSTFNIADSCLTCGAVLAVVLVLFGVPFTTPAS